MPDIYGWLIALGLDAVMVLLFMLVGPLNFVLIIALLTITPFIAKFTYLKIKEVTKKKTQPAKNVEPTKSNISSFPGSYYYYDEDDDYSTGTSTSKTDNVTAFPGSHIRNRHIM